MQLGIENLRNQRLCDEVRHSTVLFPIGNMVINLTCLGANSPFESLEQVNKVVEKSYFPIS